VERYGPDLSADMLVKRLLKEVLNLLIIDVIETTQTRIRELGIKTLEQVKKTKENIVSFSDIRKKQTRELANFLYTRVYTAPKVQQHTEEGKRIIKQLFQYLYDNPEKMLPAHAQKVKDGMPKEDAVKDYIAGMTDRFAIEQYQKFFPRQKIKAIQMPLISE
jgi:dGTPase